jgi:hypothetical protein
MQSNRRILLGLVLIVCSAFVPQMALADVLVLRNGTRIEGKIANRVQLVKTPWAFEFVSILSGDDGAIRRVPAEELSYAIIVDRGDSVVVDFMLAKAMSTDGRNHPRRGMAKGVENGLALAGFGTALLVLGVVVRFGPKELKVTENSIEYKKTYSGLNYGFMAGGGVLMAAGLGWAFYTLAHQERPEKSVRIEPSRNGLGVEFATSF